MASGDSPTVDAGGAVVAACVVQCTKNSRTRPPTWVAATQTGMPGSKSSRGLEGSFMNHDEGGLLAVKFRRRPEVCSIWCSQALRGRSWKMKSSSSYEVGLCKTGALSIIKWIASWSYRAEV